MMRKGGLAMLLAQVPSTSIKYCQVYKIPKKDGSLWVPWSQVHCLYLPINLTTTSQYKNIGEVNGECLLHFL